MSPLTFTLSFRREKVTVKVESECVCGEVDVGEVLIPVASCEI